MNGRTAKNVWSPILALALLTAGGYALWADSDGQPAPLTRESSEAFRRTVEQVMPAVVSVPPSSPGWTAPPTSTTR